MAKTQESLSEDDRHFFLKHRWQLIESALKDSIAILSERYHIDPPATDDIYEWIKGIQAEIDSSLSTEIGDKKKISRYLRDIDAIQFVSLLMQYLEHPETLEVELTFMLGYAASQIALQANVPIGVHQALNSHLKQQANLPDSDMRKERTEQLKLDVEDAIEKAKKEHSGRQKDTDFIKQKAADSLEISKRALNKRLQGT